MATEDTLEIRATSPLEGFLKTVGFVGSMLGIVNFGLANMPDEKKVRGPTVRVKVGTSGGDDAELDGGFNSIYAWDSENCYLGWADGKHIGSGDIDDFVIDSVSGGTRAEYVGVAASTDGVCIAWVSVSQFDGTPGGAWTGDVGYYCGQPWYPSKEKAGFVDKDLSKPFIPRCTWLDKDHNNKIPRAALKFSVSGYGEDAVKTIDNSKACDRSLFGPDSGPISKRPQKRVERRARLPWMEQKLVMSNITQHTAEELCTSTTSYGPDFVGSDGKFCDMGTKTLSPLCSTENVPGCIDINNKSKTVTKRSFIARRAVDVNHKTYKAIDSWA
ncbi:hypothetical protein JDV02_009529 [Purpureocillium takamizusanense]|uniref:Uncharacterized protein n=1 Tax=Purpureocillium takamizusanense TaxID=2060973 RepID=A0A9Q8QQU6_9HYPO|nr:uncharacterized protein JDV02_009529 [Purpureocillium takamizusanense]UNI23727.1 hypothetical protein JDV02_009529 [Purpureocillium takamizusanense]